MTTRVRDFVTHAFAEVGITIDWRGEGVNETGVCAEMVREDLVAVAKEQHRYAD